MYDKQSNCVILPEYIRISKNRDRIMDYCRQIISDPSIKFNEHGIAGFVYDDRLAEDIRGITLLISGKEASRQQNSCRTQFFQKSSEGIGL